MQIHRLILTAVIALAAGSATAAGIGKDMQNIARFCLGYVETGQPGNELLEAGFNQQGRKFKKSYNASEIGGFKPVILVDPRKSNAGFGCSADFGIISRSDGATLIHFAAQATRERGYDETAVVATNGKRIPAFVKDGIAVEIGGSIRSVHSTYAAFIYFQRLN